MKTQTTIVKKIRESYVEKEVTQLDKLKKMDKKVKLPVKIFSCVQGSIFSLVLGVGMCLAMKVVGENLSFAMPLGIGVGLLGIFLLCINYPIYKRVMKKRKDKYAKQIFEISNSLLNE